MPSNRPRVNVCVTPEQHALLLELAELNGGSAAGYLRQMLDQATPLLRATVPALRVAAKEMNATKQEAGTALQAMLDAISQAGADVPPDLFGEASQAGGAASRGNAASGSERGPAAASAKP